MLKVVTLMKRRAGLSVEEFQDHCATSTARWRRKGRGYAAMCNPSRCRKATARASSCSMPSAKCGSIRPPHMKTIAESAEFAAARADEAKFLDAARTVVMPVDVHVIKDGRIPDNAVKNIEFVNKRPGMALEPFRAYWRNVHGPLASTIPVMHRYEQNHLALSEYERNAAPPYDGLAITWFASTADMRRGTTTPEYAATRADEPNFLPDGHLPIIVAREHVVV